MNSKFFTTAIVSATMTLLPLMATADDQKPQEKEVIVGISDALVPGGFDSQTDAYVIESGVFPNGCYKWKRAEVTNPKANLLEVRTIASVSQGMCLMVLVPFTKEVKLGKLEAGTHTVRFVNGDGTYLERTLTVEE
jgi:hypothetical protein